MSQMCDQGHTCNFDSGKCKIKDRDTCKLVATTTRTSNNVYILYGKYEKWYLG